MLASCFMFLGVVKQLVGGAGFCSLFCGHRAELLLPYVLFAVKLNVPAAPKQRTDEAALNADCTI